MDPSGTDFLPLINFCSLFLVSYDYFSSILSSQRLHDDLYQLVQSTLKDKDAACRRT